MTFRCRSLVSLLLTLFPPSASWTAVRSTLHSPSSSTRSSQSALSVVRPQFPATLSRRACRSRGALKMGAEENEIEGEVREMRASKIKLALEEMSVPTTGVFEKEGLVQLLVTEKIRRLGDTQQPPPPAPTPSPSSQDKRASYEGGGAEWTPPPESWTEAKF
ncbi:unnamed protein product, partial [Ectocarpus sp. 6 AP-2014]